MALFSYIFYLLHNTFSYFIISHSFHFNMASIIYQTLSTLIFLYITLNSSISVSGQECPYPCNQQPIGNGNTNTGGAGGGNNPPVTTFSPPAQAANYPPPSTTLPYYNPPNTNVYGTGPPTPDTVVPWFPYYSKKPSHSTDQPSSKCGHIRSINVILFISFLVLSLWA